MIPQKLDHLYEPFGRNNSGGLWYPEPYEITRISYPHFPPDFTI
jgi:hypothetical protein